LYNPSVSGSNPIGFLNSTLVGNNTVRNYTFNTDSPNFDCNNAVDASGLITIQCSGIYNINARLNANPITPAIPSPSAQNIPITFYIYVNGQAVASANGRLLIDASGNTTSNATINLNNIVLNLKRNDKLTLAIGTPLSAGPGIPGAPVTFNFDGRINALFVSRAPQNCTAPAAPVDSE